MDAPPDQNPLPRRLHPYEVHFLSDPAGEAVVLSTTRDANRATLAFQAARQRLWERRMAGELRLVEHGAASRVLLREAVGRPSPQRQRRPPWTQDRPSQSSSEHRPARRTGAIRIDVLPPRGAVVVVDADGLMQAVSPGPLSCTRRQGRT
jgi:hypothetical protein